jgi:hypothetical protein
MTQWRKEIRSEEVTMRRSKQQVGPSAEGFTLASVLAAFAALGEAFEAAAEVRQGISEGVALTGGFPDLASHHRGAAEAYGHAAQQLLDLVAALEDEDAPWEGTACPDGATAVAITSPRPDVTRV